MKEGSGRYCVREGGAWWRYDDDGLAVTNGTF